jgi:NAD(P)-dependent dehydrogenase (short-subunit alcohol dehydrogenase family)
MNEGPVTKQAYILVVGAAEGGLGEAISQAIFEDPWTGSVVTAGIAGEQEHLDLSERHTVLPFLEAVQPSHVICTVGINIPFSIKADEGSYYMRALQASMESNVLLPMGLLSDFTTYWAKRRSQWKENWEMNRAHFVAISSNSAHIARSRSGPYCASKAALSMALRCAARELAEEEMVVYGCEPGLLEGTPMTKTSREAFAGELHRMPGVPPRTGLSTRAIARMVVGNLRAGRELNGTMIRVDAGEQ